MCRKGKLNMLGECKIFFKEFDNMHCLEIIRISLVDFFIVNKI